MKYFLIWCNKINYWICMLIYMTYILRLLHHVHVLKIYATTGRSCQSYASDVSTTRGRHQPSRRHMSQDTWHRCSRYKRRIDSGWRGELHRTYSRWRNRFCLSLFVLLEYLRAFFFFLVLAIFLLIICLSSFSFINILSYFIHIYLCHCITLIFFLLFLSYIYIQLVLFVPQFHIFLYLLLFSFPSPSFPSTSSPIASHFENRK